MDMNVDEDVEEIKVNDEILTEVAVDYDAPIEEDDESVAVTDRNENEDLDDEYEDAENIVDMSLCTFNQHTDSVYTAAINPKIPYLILTGGGDDVAYLWKYNSSGNIDNSIKLDGHKDTVSSVGFNYDGTLALTGSYDGTIRIWNALTGELKQLLEGPEDIEWAEWHSKGNAVIAGSSDGTIWMWMAHNGQCLQVFAGHDGGVCHTRNVLIRHH